jgi:hypothetical protein
MPREESTMAVVDLPAGPIEYEDTGGSGPVIVLLHGLVMNGTLWRHVVADLRDDYRCVAPTLPLGGHRLAMHADADLPLREWPGWSVIFSSAWICATSTWSATIGEAPSC